MSSEPPTAPNGRRAVVLGASMAGLLAARALSESFDEVVVVDRDDLTGAGPRKGVPQALHTHVLLQRGEQILEEFFPGLRAELVDHGATPTDQLHDVAWFSSGRRLAPGRSDLTALTMSRSMLEDRVRARVTALANVQLRGNLDATRLLASAGGDAVTGVHLTPVGSGDDEDLTAELVVNATGRGNRTMAWFAELGYDLPDEDIVKPVLAYSTREYVRNKPLPSGATTMVAVLLSAAFPQGAALLPIEGERWIITLIGSGDQVPPTDPDGFEAFSLRMPFTDLHDVVENAEPITEPRPYRVPPSVRRRYERLARLPLGYLVMGDALCAFNPVYGQGMAVAAIEATVLRDCLRASRDDIPRRYYTATAPFIDVPWNIAAGGDLAFPTTVGRRTVKTRVLNAYIARILRAAEVDSEVGVRFHRVASLVSPPETLFEPAMFLRVLFPRRLTPWINRENM